MRLTTMQPTTSSLIGRKNAVFAFSIVSLMLLALFASAAHATQSTSPTVNSHSSDADQGLPCTGSGSTQQGECQDQFGSQTGPDTGINEVSGAPELDG